MGTLNDAFDFIIVGGGTAGCLLAYRLANAPSKPSILLLESGSENRETHLRIPQERYSTFFTSGLDRGYLTTPQKGLNGREIQYFRGQGLGGSSCVNFMQYSRGSSADYDEWARIVEDDTWKWVDTKERFKRIEHHHDPTPDEWKKYAHSNSADHGFDGPVDVSLPRVWERELSNILAAVEEAGYPINPDHNSGNVIGWAASVSATDGKYRTTSASSTMYNKPKNITVRTKQVATKVIIQNGVAVGILLADGSKVYARNDVVLSAGPFDTPKLLLLSGIGPTTELSTHSIPTTHHLAGVGKNLKDHYGVFLVTQHAPSFSTRPAIEQDTKSRAPRTSWEADETGYYRDANSCVAIAYVRSPTLLSTPEFQDLDLTTRKFLVNSKVPHFEHLPGLGPIFPGFDPDAGSIALTSLSFVQNAQSSGSVTLRSADPSDHPVIDCAYLSHPYDRQVIIHAVRDAMKLYTSTKLSNSLEKFIFAPKSDSEDDILAFAKDAIMPEYHANGTAKMGPSEDPMACVDTEFRVYGVRKLRVVDLSVCPITPNAHTQGVAYVIAETAAEKIIQEYEL